MSQVIVQLWVISKHATKHHGPMSSQVHHMESPCGGQKIMCHQSSLNVHMCSSSNIVCAQASRWSSCSKNMQPLRRSSVSYKPTRILAFIKQPSAIKCSSNVILRKMEKYSFQGSHHEWAKAEYVGHRIHFTSLLYNNLQHINIRDHVSCCWVSMGHKYLIKSAITCRGISGRRQGKQTAKGSHYIFTLDIMKLGIIATKLMKQGLNSLRIILSLKRWMANRYQDGHGVESFIWC